MDATGGTNGVVGLSRVGIAAVPGGIRGRSVVLAAVMALALGAPAAAQFSAQPVILELRTEVTPSVAVFHVRNESNDPLQLRVYASDYDQPAGGGTVFLDLGTHERTCADRIEVFPDNLLLPPRAAGEVRIRMAPGDSTCWSLVFAQSVTRSADGIQIAQRIGVRVYGVAPGARTEGEVRHVAVATETDGSRAIDIEFGNTGTAPLRPSGEVEVRTEGGKVVAVVPVAPFSVLPGRAGRTRIPLDAGLSPGSYLLIPILDFGGDYLAGGQARLEVRDS